MRAFEYVEPTTLGEALAALADDDARALAGGVSLMVLIKNRLVALRRVVNLKTIPGLDGLRVGPDGALHVGPLVTHRTLERSALVRERWPLLASAATQVASPVIRNMGTIGGNVCHGDPAADLPPALIALGARFQIATAGGDREIPAEAFQRDVYETALPPGAILREIVVPPAPPGSAGVYVKLQRNATDLAIVGVAAQLALDGDHCRGACIAVGAAGAAPVRVHAAEACLAGRAVDEALARRAGQLAREAVEPLDDARGSAWYRREMVGVMVARAVLAAATNGRR